MDYEIVPYRRELDAQILQLQTHLWSSDPALNAAYLKWKYTDNPFCDQPLIYLALSQGTVVGMRGLFGTLWEVDDAATRHFLPSAEDLVVAPQHRNRTVVSRIMTTCLEDAARRGIPYAVSLAAGPVTFLSSLAAGWRKAGSYQSMWRAAAEPGVAGRLRKLLGERPLDRLDRAARQLAPPIAISRQPRPEAMAELVARRPWDGRIRHVRDARYFEWRFRNPLHQYRFLFWDDGELRGYLVLQQYQSSKADSRAVNIADCEASDERVRAALLAGAMHVGSATRIHAWTAGLEESTRTLLLEHGFAAAAASDVSARSSGLLVRQLATTPASQPWQLGQRNLLNLADWDLRMLYSMTA